MAGAVLGKDELMALVEHFGLKHCRHITVDIQLDGLVVVTAEIYPEIDGVRQLEAIMKRYHLKEIET